MARFGKGLAADKHQMGAATRLQHDIGAGLEDHELLLAENAGLTGDLDLA